MTEKADYDSPWKNALEVYFEQFVQFFFPDMAGEVDWSRPHDFLDKELQQIARDGVVGRRYADKLVRLYRTNGRVEWVLTHVEVQGQQRTTFSERMYVYNYRIFDLFHRKVASIAILVDDSPSWRPDHFSYTLWGSRAGLWFRTVKLLDYRERWAEMEADRNPFASVVMAHLRALETRDDVERRYRYKLMLIKRLYRLGYSKADVVLLFGFIDWLMALPRELEDRLWADIHQHEEGKRMEYITSVEKIGFRRGIEQGMQQGGVSLLRRQISRRFKIEADQVVSMLEGLDNAAIEELGERLFDAESLEQFREWVEGKRAQMIH